MCLTHRASADLLCPAPRELRARNLGAGSAPIVCAHWLPNWRCLASRSHNAPTYLRPIDGGRPLRPACVCVRARALVGLAAPLDELVAQGERKQSSAPLRASKRSS